MTLTDSAGLMLSETNYNSEQVNMEESGRPNSPVVDSWIPGDETD